MSHPKKARGCDPDNPRPAVMAWGRRFYLDRPRRPIERMSVARLIACETPADVAGWCRDRLMVKAWRGDKDAEETIKALGIYCDAQKLLARDGDS